MAEKPRAKSLPIGLAARRGGPALRHGRVAQIAAVALCLVHACRQVFKVLGDDGFFTLAFPQSGLMRVYRTTNKTDRINKNTYSTWRNAFSLKRVRSRLPAAKPSAMGTSPITEPIRSAFSMRP